MSFNSVSSFRIFSCLCAARKPFFFFKVVQINVPSIASCWQGNPSARLWMLQRTKKHVKMSLKTTKGKLLADKSSSLTGLLFALMSVRTDTNRDSNAVTGWMAGGQKWLNVKTNKQTNLTSAQRGCCSVISLIRTVQLFLVKRRAKSGHVLIDLLRMW